MNETVYNKLVRDKILDIISVSGKKSTYHIARDEEYLAKLREKVVEELEEFMLTPTIEEAADILEVVYTLFEHHGLKMEEIEKARGAKATERGGFGQRHILEKVFK